MNPFCGFQLNALPTRLWLSMRYAFRALLLVRFGMARDSVFAETLYAGPVSIVDGGLRPGSAPDNLRPA